MSEALDTAAGDVVHHLAEPVDPLLSQWAKFRPQFAEAMGEGGFWTVEHIEQKIAHRRAMFFPGRDAALVAEIVSYPGGEQAMQILWAVGDLPELITMLPGVESIARMQGCTSMEIEGRPAWQRVLKASGYDPWSVTIRKAL